MKLRQWLGRLGRNSWSDWPGRAYARESYQQRLAAVETHLAESIDLAAAGPVRIVSLCAGDGRDVIDVLETHPRRADVTAWLVELAGNSVAAGAERVQQAGLQEHVHFRQGDATDLANYRDIAPADVVLVCGVWGHVPVDERGSLVRGLCSLCKPGGRVIWTRGISRGEARLHEIQAQFAGPGWEAARLTITPNGRWAAATYRYAGPGAPLPESGRLFHFQTTAGN